MRNESITLQSAYSRKAHPKACDGSFDRLKAPVDISLKTKSLLAMYHTTLLGTLELAVKKRLSSRLRPSG